MSLFEAQGARKNVHTKKSLVKIAAHAYLDHMKRIKTYMWSKLPGVNFFTEKYTTEGLWHIFNYFL